MQNKIFTSPVLFAIAFLVLPFLSRAQDKIVVLPKNSSGQIEYLENISLPNTPQSVLFKRAMHWVVSSKIYKFRKIDLLDRDFGRLIAQGKFIVNSDEVFISITIDAKDNRVQLKVNRFDYNMAMGNVSFDNLTNVKAKEVKMLTPKVADRMKDLIKDFKDTISSTAKI